MEKTTSKVLLVFSIFVMAIVVGAEGGGDVPKSYDQVYQQPQGPWGLIWPFFPLPLPGFGGNTPPGSQPFGGIPGLGPLNFPTFAFPPPPSAPKYGIGGPQAHTRFKEMAQAKSP